MLGLVEAYERIIKSEGKLNVAYLELNIKGTIDRYLNYQGTGVAIPEYQLQKSKAEIVADRVFGAWMYGFRTDDPNAKSINDAYDTSIQRMDQFHEGSFYNDELNEELSTIMWELTTRERDIINMSYGVNLPKKSMKEISNILEMSLRGAEDAKKRALKKLNTLKNAMIMEKYL